MCGSSARTDLYGGQLAIAVPTVTETYPNESNIPRTDRRLLDGYVSSVPARVTIRTL